MNRVTVVANAAASGTMLAATLGLLVQGLPLGAGRVGLGVVAGALFVAAVRRGAQAGEAARALVIVGVMAVHSAAEGVAAGTSFAGGQPLGGLVSGALAVHKAPEVLAVALVLVSLGRSRRAAFGLGLLTTLPLPLVAVAAYAWIGGSAALLPAGLGFAAGAMLLLVSRELLPEALERSTPRLVAAAGGAAFALMAGVEALFT